MSLTRLARPGEETVAALAGTVFSAGLLVLAAMYAGPLWRDEVNTLNLAQMSSLQELWDNQTYESFPPLWPLLLRGGGLLGMAGSDAGVRVLGLYVGLLFLISIWSGARWIGGRAPILSIALLGGLPAFVFIVGANRAYGLASCLLVLSFGLVWRMVELPSRLRILSCAFTCLLFAHCVYYDIVFLGAILAGASLVAIRRQRWKVLMALAVIGAVSSGSLIIYLPIIHRGSDYASMMRYPSFDFPTLWNKLGLAASARSSAHPDGPAGPEIWLWIVLLVAGLFAAFVVQRGREHAPQNEEAAKTNAVRVRADRALFCVASLLLGAAGHVAFLFRLHYLTQTWYYIEMLVLCAIALDGLLNVNWPALRPWGLLRIGFMAAMMTWCAGSAWEEAHTRRSNVDLVAAVLDRKASAGDLIVVSGAWEGVTFDRYYHGRTPWVTVPPISSHKMHRNDLVMEMINQTDPMAPALQGITDTLRSGNSVWIVGNLATKHPKPPPSSGKSWELYSKYWSGEITALLQDHALQEQFVEIPLAGPVSHLEDLPVLRFSGYKSGAE